jgi:glycosyltransferase involved in cell wall biosynthesis
MRLAVLASHPIQYQAPLFRELSRRIELSVFFAHRAMPNDQANAGFGVYFDWDVDLLSGYDQSFLRNVSKRPSVDRFTGCDTPDIGARLAKGRFDALLIMGWHLKSYIQALVAAKCLGMPVLARGDSQLGTTRPAMKKLIKAFTYPLFLRNFNAALYVGERSRAYWLYYRYPSARMFFSPHCVDAKWFASRATDRARAVLRERLRLNPHSKVALFAGKLVGFKRPLDLIAAAEHLKRQGYDIEILLAGAGPLEQEIVTAARAAGVALHTLGFCNQSEMPAAYAAADVLVLPSQARETWGLVANEALACRRPILVSDAVGAAPDLAADGIVGRVYPMGDTVRLAQALKEILLHPPTLEAIAARSSRYSIAAAVDGIVRATAFAVQRAQENSYTLAR